MCGVREMSKCPYCDGPTNKPGELAPPGMKFEGVYYFADATVVHQYCHDPWVANGYKPHGAVEVQKAVDEYLRSVD